MAKITFDGIEVEVPDGTTILNAARKIGGGVVPPAMCYYTPLKGSGGKCRACLVRVAAGSAKDPRPMPKLVASCITPVQDGMVVENTTSQQVLDVRKGIVEMLLSTTRSTARYATRPASATCKTSPSSTV